MNLCKNVTLLLTVFLVYIEFGASKPTFGNEYVHIKVHVPKEVTVQHDSIDETSFHHSPPVHKIIHHYHRRGRRPSSKKVVSSKHNHQHDHHQHHDHHQQQHNDGVPDVFLNNIILSELKTPINSDHLEYLHHADDITEHLAKPKIKYVPKKNVNTYTIIEETKKMPKKLQPHIETVKIIESTVPTEQIETYKIIESKQPAYKPRQHIETIKVVNSVADEHRDHHDHHNHYETRKPHIENIKIIESTAHDHVHNYNNHDHDHGHDHYDYKPRTSPLDDYEQHSVGGGSNTYYPKKSSSYYNRQHYHDDEYNSAAYERPKQKYQNHQYTHYDDDRGYQQSDGSSYSHSKDYESYGPPATTRVRDHPHGTGSSYDSYLPSSESDYHIPVDSYLPPRDNDHLPIDSYSTQNDYNFNANAQPNTLYDDEVFDANGYLPPVDIAHSERESYTGIDSYNAKHVQGVGSGVYKYPSTYP